MRVVLLDFDGTCYRGDLPVQAYARRVAELLDEPAATLLIAGMRCFLEGKPPPDGMPPEFDTAEDGYELVRAIANQAGLRDEQRRAAYYRSREDLARTAFVLDPEPGLAAWLAELRESGPTQVWLATLAPDTGIREVLDAVDLLPLVDRILPRTGKPDGIGRLAAEAVTLAGDPHRVLGIGDRWAADLAPVQGVGGRTAHLDRFRRGLGTPDWRSGDLEPLLPDLYRWAEIRERERVMPVDLPTPDGVPAELPDFTLAHLSDTHLRPVGSLYNDAIDADEALASVVAELRRAQDNGRRFDAVVASGDLTDTGDPDAYRRLASALEPLGVPLIWATGNHDVRTTFHRELLGVRDWDEQRVQQIWIAERLRVVVLDSTVVGAGHGRLDPSTITTLTEILSQPAAAGTVVVLHHAPIPPPSPLLTYFALERASREALGRAVAGTDVRLILAGHHHLAQSGVLAGVPVAVAGSAAIRLDPLSMPGHERTTRSRSFNLVQLYPDTHVVSVLPVDGADQVFDLDPAACAEIVARHPAS